MPLTSGACSLRSGSVGYGDATDGAIAVGAELELTGGPQRFQLPENLLQDPMAEGNTTAHVFLAGDEDSHSPWTDSQGPRQGCP